jgi:hypothetical protein
MTLRPKPDQQTTRYDVLGGPWTYVPITAAFERWAAFEVCLDLGRKGREEKHGERMKNVQY